MESSVPDEHASRSTQDVPIVDDSKRPPVPRLNPRSCITCRRRKVRCNKQDPCANCVRAGIECIFPAPGRAPRKSRKPPDAELLARLKRLEGVVNSLGAQVDEHGIVSPTVAGTADIRARSFADTRVADSPSSERSDSKRQSIDKSLGRLVINEDRSRYVSNTFWTGMSEEIAEMQDLLDLSTTDEEDESNSPVQDRQTGSHQGFLFGYSSIKLDLRELHPSPSQIFILWEVFKENVDPVVRMLHRPTARTILMNAASSLDRVSRPAEALLFSIYYGAVVSMTHEQCRQLLDEDKELLLKRYRFATEQALARADFLNSSSLMCLQAFAFFLVFVRHVDESRSVWALGGLAIHLAQSLGIHRDGTNFGLSPFDTEMRRRLWWHLSLMDNRAAEDHGTDPTFSEQFYDTKLPMNYNDDDIYPGMKEYPPERQTATEMTFCLIRSELSILPRRLNFTAPGAMPGQTQEMTLEQKEKMIDECHRHLEEKYLHYCDPNVPIHWVAATVARLILAKMWLSIHHPRSFGSPTGDALLPQEVRDRVFITSVEVLEFTHLLEKNEKTAKWGWFFRTYMQWQSVAFALSEICARPPGPEVDRAWRAVEAVYDERVIKNSKFQRGMLWKPLRHLMARAQELRKAQQAARAAENDTFFRDVGSSTTVEKFTQDYPDNMVSLTLDAFGMGLDEPFSADVPVQPMTSGSPQGTTAMHATAAGTFSQDGSSDTNLTPGQLSLSTNEILKFGWSPSLGDFAGRQEPFQRFFMNVQEEWF